MEKADPFRFSKYETGFFMSFQFELYITFNIKSGVTLCRISTSVSSVKSSKQVFVLQCTYFILYSYFKNTVSVDAYTNYHPPIIFGEM